MQSQPTASMTIGAAAVALGALALLHLVRPELEPSSHMISEYAIGPHGYLMTLSFAAFAILQPEPVRRAVAFGTRCPRPRRSRVSIACGNGPGDWRGVRDGSDHHESGGDVLFGQDARSGIHDWRAKPTARAASPVPGPAKTANVGGGATADDRPRGVGLPGDHGAVARSAALLRNPQSSVHGGVRCLVDSGGTPAGEGRAKRCRRPFIEGAQCVGPGAWVLEVPGCEGAACEVPGARCERAACCVRARGTPHPAPSHPAPCTKPFARRALRHQALRTEHVRAAVLLLGRRYCLQAPDGFQSEAMPLS